MTKLSILSKDIRTLDGLYSLNDLHKVSGGVRVHQPSNFIRLNTTQELIQEIERSSDVRIGVNNQRPDLVFAPIAKFRGGRNQGTWVCKELVYAYAMWISPKFHLQVIRAFDAMTSQQPAIPAIEHKQPKFAITQDQLIDLIWLWFASERMRYTLCQVREPLRLLHSSYAVEAIEHSQTFKTKASKAREALLPLSEALDFSDFRIRNRVAAILPRLHKDFMSHC